MIDWVPAGDAIRVIPAGTPTPSEDPTARLQLFDQASERRRTRSACLKPYRETEVGAERIFTIVAALVDTNILIYRFDNRFSEKQRIATEVLRRGIIENSGRVPHQVIGRPVGGITKLPPPSRPTRLSHIF